MMNNHPHPARSLVTLFLVAASSSLIGSCNRQPVPEVVEPPAMVVQNTELRLRLAGVPGELAIVTNDGDRLILRPAESASAGEIIFANRPPEAGQNLPVEVKAHQSLIESQDGGDALGARELTSQLGTTYTSRGRYLLNGTETEETTIFALHPYADRIMTITYRYPAGADSSERVQQLIDVLATVEGLD